MNKQDTMSSTSFILFCWNIGNPSLERAAKQAAWLRKQSSDIFLLTECKQSEGCRFLEKYFQAYGYQVVFPKPPGNEYGVLIASKHPMTPTKFTNYVEYLQSRVVSVKLPFLGDEVEIIGSYVPSRDASYEKKLKKREFLNNLLAVLEKAPTSSSRIVAGDFNILEPDHVPRYSTFEEWEYDFYRWLAQHQLRDAFRHLHPKDQEYSWVGRMGDGYRYDHCFVSSNLLPLVCTCSYLHTPRLERLSDHSALITEIVPRGTSES